MYNGVILMCTSNCNAIYFNNSNIHTLKIQSYGIDYTGISFVALEELVNHVPQLVGKHHVSFGRCLLGKAGYEPNTIDPILDDIMHRCNSSGNAFYMAVSITF